MNHMQPGDKLSTFTLRRSDGELHEVKPGGKGVLILFLCNHCPYVHRYASRIEELASTYLPQGLEVWGINSNDAARVPEDAFDKMPTMAKRLGLEGRYLHDADQSIARQLRAERTPEAYLFNPAGELVYRGAIDDNHEDAKLAREHYLRDAIEAILLNHVLQNQYETPVGCTIKWKQHG